MSTSSSTPVPSVEDVPDDSNAVAAQVAAEVDSSTLAIACVQIVLATAVDPSDCATVLTANLSSLVLVESYHKIYLPMTLSYPPNLIVSAD